MGSAGGRGRLAVNGIVACSFTFSSSLRPNRAVSNVDTSSTSPAVGQIFEGGMQPCESRGRTRHTAREEKPRVGACDVAWSEGGKRRT